ncbi:ATP-grasp fold amidoligase family protein [Oceanobacillus oncorhynchi]|uniref:ATP-grasp fold amidoligase family protein n=1 Tax=Oceanobacillus oncorhynchi TaxID=545501 RepID=UPI001FEC6540|nr:ATP-grasp fold amidoligase family protein [Oceanobacillus oncorhynchi]
MSKIIKDPRSIIRLLLKKNVFIWLRDKSYLKLSYFARMYKKLDLETPKTYNEKLQWLKLYDRRPEMTQQVDKYAVRNYIKEKIGVEYLIPLIGVYNNIDEIDFSKLPNQFVLKCTHDSGGVFICEDKSNINIVQLKRKFQELLNTNYYYYFREWPYKNVNPRIICEKYLQDNIIDYKIMCFHGEPKLIQIHQDRDTEEYTQTFYDVDWKKTNISRKNTRPTNKSVEKPVNLEEMLSIAKKLSKEDIHVRIDLFEVNGKIYFGEKTYFPASGFSRFNKDEYDELLGEWLDINNL